MRHYRFPRCVLTVPDFCHCVVGDPRRCPVHGMTPRQVQIRQFEAAERQKQGEADALAECEQYGHIYGHDDLVCVRCGSLDTSEFFAVDHGYPLDPEAPF